MNPFTLPGNNVPLPAFGLGGAPLGNLYDRMSNAQARATIDTAWEGGIRHFDTAPHYGLGLSETRLGSALAGTCRDEYVLSTKVGRLLRPNPSPAGRDAEGFDVPDSLMRVRDYSRDGVLRSIEESLARLRTDRIDIVYIHDPDDFTYAALTGAVPALTELREAGVIGAWGVGMNHTDALLRFVRETDVDLIMLAGRYTLLEQGAAADLLPACMQRNVGVVNVGVFNSGLLATERPQENATYNYTPASRELLARAHRLADVCEAYGVPLPAAAMQFPVAHPAVSSVLLGMRTPGEVHRNLELAELHIPDQLWADLRHHGLISTPEKETS